MSRPQTFDIPEHVRRIIEQDGEVTFTPPSFERWLGRLQMFRTLSSMGAFLAVWLFAYGNGMAWEAATIRAMAAGIVFHFFAWAIGLFLFGELYDAEVKQARHDLEEKERIRAQRIEDYYRQRLEAQESSELPGDELASRRAANAGAVGAGAPEAQRYAA